MLRRLSSLAIALKVCKAQFLDCCFGSCASFGSEIMVADSGLMYLTERGYLHRDV